MYSLIYSSSAAGDLALTTKSGATGTRSGSTSDVSGVEIGDGVRDDIHGDELVLSLPRRIQEDPCEESDAATGTDRSSLERWD